MLRPRHALLTSCSAASPGSARVLSHCLCDGDRAGALAGPPQHVCDEVSKGVLPFYLPLKIECWEMLPRSLLRSFSC